MRMLKKKSSAKPSPISHRAVTHMGCLATDLMPSPCFDAPTGERQHFGAIGIGIERVQRHTGNRLFPGWWLSLPLRKI